jgi:hypothetical protein
MFQTKVVQKIKTYFVFNNFLFRVIVPCMRSYLLTPWSKVLLDETIWANITVGPDSPQLTIRRVHFANRMKKTRIRTNTHTHTHTHTNI